MNLKSTEASPPSREMDDRAIEALCDILDRGGSLWNGEPWSTILRRRLRGSYDAKMAGRSMWMQTHFQLRYFIDGDEQMSANYVAGVWNRSAQTVLSHANYKDEALRWIDAELTRARKISPDGKHAAKDAEIYKMLDAVLTLKAQEFPAK